MAWIPASQPPEFVEGKPYSENVLVIYNDPGLREGFRWQYGVGYYFGPGYSDRNHGWIIPYVPMVYIGYDAVKFWQPLEAMPKELDTPSS